jgi:hypothetical protein
MQKKHEKGKRVCSIAHGTCRLTICWRCIKWAKNHWDLAGVCFYLWVMIRAFSCMSRAVNNFAQNHLEPATFSQWEVLKYIQSLSRGNDFVNFSSHQTSSWELLKWIRSQISAKSRGLLAHLPVNPGNRDSRKHFNELSCSKIIFHSVILAAAARGVKSIFVSVCGSRKIRGLKMNYTTFMSSMPLREDILDDVTYLQKHLRLIIKFHQVSANRPQVQHFLRWIALVMWKSEWLPTRIHTLLGWLITI